MPNQEHLDILKQSVEAWNNWRKEYPDIQPDLEGADLSYSKLSNANLSHAILSHTNLSNADFYFANLNNADLSNADLTNATLFEANFRHAILFEANLGYTTHNYCDLSNANLSNANLTSANFINVNLNFANLSNANLTNATLIFVDLINVNLSNADLTGANLALAVFGSVDLRAAKGLEAVKHVGPLIIGIDTIYQSQGNIPEVFLKGAGVDDTFITYIHSLVGKAIEYYSCFISYSSKDDAFARRLYADLQSQNIRCWFAPEDLKWGDKIRTGIDEAIHLHDKL